MTDSGEPRKASDVLLGMEAKINALIGAFNTLNFNLNVLSNKLSKFMSNGGESSPKFTAEAVNTTSAPVSVDPNQDRNILISSEDALPMEMEPKGFRRTSRPETFAGDNAHLTKPKPKEETIKFPVQIPRGNRAEVIVPSQLEPSPAPKAEAKAIRTTGGNIPVMQRMVDGNGKSIFLGDVNIIDNSSKETVLKTRTNGVGKWMASLPIGEYTVTMTKRSATTKEPVEVTQTVKVDGLKSPLDLPICIVKG